MEFNNARCMVPVVNLTSAYIRNMRYVPPDVRKKYALSVGINPDDVQRIMGTAFIEVIWHLSGKESSWLPREESPKVPFALIHLYNMENFALSKNQPFNMPSFSKILSAYRVANSMNIRAAEGTVEREALEKLACDDVSPPFLTRVTDLYWQEISPAWAEFNGYMRKFPSPMFHKWATA